MTDVWSKARCICLQRTEPSPSFLQPRLQRSEDGFCRKRRNSRAERRRLILFRFLRRLRPCADCSENNEMQDLEAAIGALRGHPQIDKENLFLFGASQGGLVTAMTAARHADETRGIVLLFPALCIADNWRERYPTAADIPEETELWGMKLGRKFFESIRSFDPFSLLGNYRRSVLILHGERDEVVPIAYSRRAQKLYPHADMVEFPGEGHGFSPAGETRMTQLLLAFVQEKMH